MPLKYRDLSIFGKIGRESGSVSQNRETHFLWGEELTGMIKSYWLIELLKDSIKYSVYNQPI